jgi:DNA-binding NarL/FixJ family response regulator
MLFNMDSHTVLIIGDSLFAETLTATLTKSAQVVVQASVPSLEGALAEMARQMPDIVLIASANEMGVGAAGRLLAHYPNLAIIHAGLDMDNVQVITSQAIGRGTADLINAIAKLPHRDLV